MSGSPTNVEIAQQTLALLAAGRYTSAGGITVDIAAAQQAAVEGVTLYTPAALTELIGDPRDAGEVPAGRVRVTNETTQQAAYRLAVAEGRDDVGVLNFASARNEGGGFLNGSRAQEEELCRCSGLYPSLTSPAVATYYRVNRAESSLLYTDHAIVTPRVPWFRLAAREPLMDQPFLATVITMPAPNAGPLLERDPSAGPSIVATFRRRWGQVLAMARAHGVRSLVLGAWGCGAFRNKPAEVAATFLPWLRDPIMRDFDRIDVAIPRTGTVGTANHDAFAAALGSGDE